MTWFPNELQIPPDCNMPYIDNAISVLDKCENPGGLDRTPNITFMIPVAFDTPERGVNLSYTMLWLLLNTKASLHIHICETKKNILSNKSAWSQTAFSKNEDERARNYTLLSKFIDKHADADNVINEDCSFGHGEDFFNFLINFLHIPSILSHHSIGDDDMCFYDFARAFIENSLPPLDRQSQSILPDPTALYDSFRSRIKCTLSLREDDAPFHRTKYLNKMISSATTPFVCSHDADVIIPTDSIDRSLYYMEKLNADVVYPYGHAINGNFQRRIFLGASGMQDCEAMTSQTLQNNFHGMITGKNVIEWSAAYGQSIFVRTSFYKSVGGENEQFLSWGAEDVERYVRFMRFGGRVARLAESLIAHLEHPRGQDSSPSNPSFDDNELLWYEIQRMTTAQLCDYYKHLEYIKQYGWDVQLQLNSMD
jgi:hypothetical protein